MAVSVAALLERRPALLALRRALPRSAARVLTARSPRHLDQLLRTHLVDAVVLGAEAARGPVLESLRHDFAAIPVLLYVPFRSDDADLVARAARLRVAALAVEGVDEPVLPRLLGQAGLQARRIAELLPLAEWLDLVDPIQRRAWAALVVEAPTGLDTGVLAKRLAVRRETLSRRFGAGRAPSLKRATDAIRVVAAAELLGCAALGVADVATILGFSSASLLHRTAKRALGVPLSEVAALSPAALVTRLAPPRRWG